MGFKCKPSAAEERNNFVINLLSCSVVDSPYLQDFDRVVGLCSMCHTDHKLACE